MIKSDYLDELHPESFGFKKEDYEKNIYLGGVIIKTINYKRNIKIFEKNLLWANWL